MDRPVPRVLAMHDLSGVGKCSLTVILPILSVMGVEVAALPTAVLSTHTGGIEGYTFRDLTCDMLPMARHWHSLGLTFAALYSGWLGSADQAAIVSEIFSLFPGRLRLVDPVMGDNGMLYSTYGPDRVAGIAGLCGRADVIAPNLTEACFLLGEPYRADTLSADEAHALCLRLARLGPRQVVITGVSTQEGLIGAATLDGRGGYSLHQFPKIPGVWHGTGDIFCAVLLGALLRGRTLGDAAGIAVGFTHGCIARTHALGVDPRLGVDFERGLAALAEEMRDGRQA